MLSAMEGAYHDDGVETIKDTAFKEEMRCDIGNEAAEKWKEAMQCTPSEAKLNGMTDTECDALKTLIWERRDMVCVLYICDPSAGGRQLRTHLMQRARLMRANARQYLPEKQPFLRSSVVNLQK